VFVCVFFPVGVVCVFVVNLQDCFLSVVFTVLTQYTAKELQEAKNVPQQSHSSIPFPPSFVYEE